MRNTWEEPEGEEEVPHRMFIKKCLVMKQKGRGWQTWERQWE